MTKGSLRTPTSAVMVIVLFGCSSPTTENASATATVTVNPSAVSDATSAPRDLRTQLDGHGFPDGVLALTFDDGPDAHTLELAEYLSREKISATFFVVNAWIDDVSADPGKGDDVFASGAELVPVLGDLVQLGHRVANHTQNHVLLANAPTAVVTAQLRDAQRSIDPFIRDELQLFRVPGGAWDSSAATAVAADPALADLVGPMRWDIDRKDWEGSLYCRSSHPATECEPRAPGGALRVKPSVIAARYLSSIEEARHGIVLMHARVGHVGSRYALDVAHALVPELRARGYVFAAPILHFSAPLVRFPAAPEDTRFFDPEDTTAIALGDIDGDGHADLCASDGARIVCATSELHVANASGLQKSMFGHARLAPLDPRHGFHLADVNGDGRTDLCAQTARGLECALASEEGAFGVATLRSSEFAEGSAAVFGDVDGDGKADVCGFAGEAIWCAKSTGYAFERARRWLSGVDAAWGATLAIGDFDGNGRADICGRTPGGVACALSNGSAFGAIRTWSPSGDFIATNDSRLLAGDLNGDGRADICEQRSESIVCALSTGSAFVRSTSWSETGAARGELAVPILADINGDGRSDLCTSTLDGITCEVAP